MSPAVSLKGWKKINASALKRGYYTRADIVKSSRWPSCAIGERYLAINNEPLDFEGNSLTKRDTHQLGMDFYDAVWKGHWKGHHAVYNSVEDKLDTSYRLSFVKHAISIYEQIQKLKKL